MKTLLAIETTGLISSVCLRTGAKEYVRHCDKVKGHSRELFPMIEQVLDEANCTKKQIDLFAFGGGPGRFTGLRLGASLMQGLSLAFEKPIVRISSLKALAQYYAGQYPNHYLALAIDGRQNTIYTAGFEHTEKGLLAVSPSTQMHPDNMPEIKTDLPIVHIGDAWQTYETLSLEKDSTYVPNHVILAPVVAHLANLAPEADYLSAEQALPIYMHEDLYRARDKQSLT